MALDLKKPYALHMFDDTKLWEQPVGSGQMYNGEGKELGKWTPLGKGYWSKLKVDLEEIPAKLEAVTAQLSAKAKSFFNKE